LLKASQNPPISWPEEVSIADFTGQWWVAHTKSRNEKALANDLAGMEISYFLPMSWKVQQSRGRKIKSLLPLFSGYLFFCGNENHRLEVLRTNRVANILEVTDQQKLINELTQIDTAIKAGAALQPHDYIKKGQRCRVIAGALANMTGIVADTRGHTKLILNIDMLGQAASVEIDTDTIELIEDERNSDEKENIE